MAMRFGGFLAVIAMVSGAQPALAADFDSAYTDLDLDACLIRHSDDFGSSWACPGYKGYPVLVAEGDLRFTVSYGFGAPDEPAASQTLPPFNTLGAKIEWRLSNREGGWKPFATIVRYKLDKTPDFAGGEVLVVTQLKEGATCQVAWVDATANADANEKARKAADELAGTHDCGEVPRVIGTFKAFDLE